MNETDTMTYLMHLINNQIRYSGLSEQYAVLVVNGEPALYKRVKRHKLVKVTDFTSVYNAIESLEHILEFIYSFNTR